MMVAKDEGEEEGGGEETIEAVVFLKSLTEIRAQIEVKEEAKEEVGEEAEVEAGEDIVTIDKSNRLFSI